MQKIKAAVASRDEEGVIHLQLVISTEERNKVETFTLSRDVAAAIIRRLTEMLI